MKNIIILLVALCFASCASDKTIDHIKYEPYGLVNEESIKCDSINYEISFGSTVCAIVFYETIITPIYIVG